MAVLELNALSKALSGSFSATVLFPDQPALCRPAYPALYFLHDVGGDDTDIRTVRGLEALAGELGIFLVCPSVMHSFGMDLPWGAKYGEFISRELPAICRHLFPLDAARQFVGGQGGGAWGACWHAAHHPDVFSRCLLVNGRFDAAGLCEAAADGAAVPHLTVPNLEAVFGDLRAVRGGPHDLLCSAGPVPRDVFVGCEENFAAAGDSRALAYRLGVPVHAAASEDALFAAGLRWLCG